MAGKIIIDTERCKGCGLCVIVCPKNSIIVSEHSNQNGYFPAQANNTDCTGCAVCAIICPDAAIEVYRDDHIVSTKAGSKKNPVLTKEKA